MGEPGAPQLPRRGRETLIRGLGGWGAVEPKRRKKFKSLVDVDLGLLKKGAANSG